MATNIYKGIYLDGKSAAINYASIAFQQGELVIQIVNSAGESSQVIWPLADIHKEVEFSGNKTILKCGAFPFQTLEVEGRHIYDGLQEFYPDAEFETSIHNRFLGKGVQALVGVAASVIALIFIAYFWIIPWGAEMVAKSIPIETEQEIGEGLFDQVTAGYSVDTAKTRVINTFFKELNYGTPYKIKVTVVNDKMVNAFALPGGNIVVMSGIISEMRSYEELAALFGHELTHINERHTTRSLFRSLGVYFVLSLMLGDASGVAAVILQNAEQLKSLQFSRELESEADELGYNHMKEAKINPQGMIDLFQRLKDASKDIEIAEFISTHPDVENRIKATKKRIAAEHPYSTAHPDLKAQFELLKAE
jgi:Zn-dependent protease with chaperone function